MRASSGRSADGDRKTLLLVGRDLLARPLGLDLEPASLGDADLERLLDLARAGWNQPD